MKLKIAAVGFTLSLSLFSCASSQTNLQSTTTSPQDTEIQAIQSKSEKAFKELEEEFQPSKKPLLSNNTTSADQEKKTERETEKTIEAAPKFTSGKIIFKECAYGKDQKDARTTAIKRLSQDIISNVNALEIAQKSLNRGKISREYFSQTKIGTRTILKGIRFQDIGRTPEGYKVCAVLTEKGLKETISYLKTTLNRNLIDLPKTELEKIKEQAFILLSLAESTNDRETVNFASQKLKEIDKLLNFGRLYVNSIPSEATIIIGNKKYASGKTILLKPEREYFITIKANGYKTIRKKIYLGRGEKRTLSVELPKIVKGDIPIAIETNVNFINNIIEKSLIDSGFKVSKDADNKLTVKVKDFTSNVNEYTKHQLEVTATLYAKGKPIVRKIGKMKPFFTTEATENSVLKTKIEKLTKAVVNSLLNNIDPKQLGGGEE